MPTTTDSNRRFLVGRQGNEVVIREVQPDSNAYEFTREQAWSMARAMARPVTRGHRRPEAAVFFQAPDGTRMQIDSTLVRAPQVRAPQAQSREIRTQVPPDHAEAARRAAAAARNGRGRPGAMNAQPTERVRYEPEPGTDLALVVADLREGNLQGRLNEWGASVLDQYERNGRLSDKQIAAGMRGVRAKQARQAEHQAQAPLPEVPTGRYAVDSAEGELRFYRLYRKQSGRVELYVQHGPDESPVPFSWDGYRTILQSIVDAGPAEAAVRYGREIGRCSRCNLRLTNRLSRELGIGPICGGHFHEHDEWLAIRGAARDAIRARGEDPDEEVRG